MACFLYSNFYQSLFLECKTLENSIFLNILMLFLALPLCSWVKSITVVIFSFEKLNHLFSDDICNIFIWMKYLMKRNVFERRIRFSYLINYCENSIFWERFLFREMSNCPKIKFFSIDRDFEDIFWIRNNFIQVFLTDFSFFFLAGLDRLRRQKFIRWRRQQIILWWVFLIKTFYIAYQIHMKNLILSMNGIQAIKPYAFVSLIQTHSPS